MNRRFRRRGRLESKEHWNQVCLTIVAIGAAVTAAALIFSGMGKERPDPVTVVTILKEMAAAATLAWYAIITLVAIRTVFQPQHLQAAERSRRRRSGAHTVFSMLGAMVFFLAVAAMSTIVIPRDIPWSNDMSRTIRISEENWEQLEQLVGREGTANEKLRRALELAGTPPAHGIPEADRHTPGDHDPWSDSANIGTRADWRKPAVRRHKGRTPPPEGRTPCPGRRPCT